MAQVVVVARLVLNIPDEENERLNEGEPGAFAELEKRLKGQTGAIRADIDDIYPVTDPES